MLTHTHTHGHSKPFHRMFSPTLTTPHTANHFTEGSHPHPQPRAQQTISQNVLTHTHNPTHSKPFHRMFSPTPTTTGTANHCTECSHPHPQPRAQQTISQNVLTHTHNHGHSKPFHRMFSPTLTPTQPHTQQTISQNVLTHTHTHNHGHSKPFHRMFSPTLTTPHTANHFTECSHPHPQPRAQQTIAQNVLTHTHNHGHSKPFHRMFSPTPTTTGTANHFTECSHPHSHPHNPTHSKPFHRMFSPTPTRTTMGTANHFTECSHPHPHPQPRAQQTIAQNFLTHTHNHGHSKPLHRIFSPTPTPTTTGTANHCTEFSHPLPQPRAQQTISQNVLCHSAQYLERAVMDVEPVRVTGYVQGVFSPTPTTPHTANHFTECSHPVHSVRGDNSDGMTWIPTRQSCLMGNLLGSGWYPPTLTTTHTQETFLQMYLTRLRGSTWRQQ